MPLQFEDRTRIAASLCRNLEGIVTPLEPMNLFRHLGWGETEEDFETMAIERAKEKNADDYESVDPDLIAAEMLIDMQKQHIANTVVDLTHLIIDGLKID